MSDLYGIREGQVYVPADSRTGPRYRSRASGEEHMTSDQLQEELGTLLGRCVNVICELEAENAELKAGRAALAEQDRVELDLDMVAPTGKDSLPVAEPVAWVKGEVGSRAVTFDAYEASCWRDRYAVTPLYAAPPRIEWQGLTDEEIEVAWKACDPQRLLPSFAAEIEAKLKEKNHEPR